MRRYQILNRIIASILAGALFLPAGPSLALRPRFDEAGLEEKLTDPEKMELLQKFPLGLPIDGAESSAMQALLLAALIEAQAQGRLQKILNRRTGDIVLSKEEARGLLSSSAFVKERLTPKKRGKGEAPSELDRRKAATSAWIESALMPNMKAVNNVNWALSESFGGEGAEPSEEDRSNLEFYSWCWDAAQWLRDSPEGPKITGVQLIKPSYASKRPEEVVGEFLTSWLAELREARDKGQPVKIKLKNNKAQVTHTAVARMTGISDPDNLDQSEWQEIGLYFRKAFKLPRWKVASSLSEEFKIQGVEFLSRRAHSGLEEKGKKHNLADQMAEKVLKALAEEKDLKEPYRKQIHPGGVLRLGAVDVHRLSGKKLKLGTITGGKDFRKKFNQSLKEALRKKDGPLAKGLLKQGIRRVELVTYLELYHLPVVASEVLVGVLKTLEGLKVNGPIGEIGLSGHDISVYAGGTPTQKILSKYIELRTQIFQELERQLKGEGKDQAGRVGKKAGKILRQRYGVSAMTFDNRSRSNWARRVWGWKKSSREIEPEGKSKPTARIGQGSRTDSIGHALEILNAVLKSKEAKRHLEAQRKLLGLSQEQPLYAVVRFHELAALTEGRYTEKLSNYPTRNDAIRRIWNLAFGNPGVLDDYEGSSDTRASLVEDLAKLCLAMPSDFKLNLSKKEEAKMVEAMEILERKAKKTGTSAVEPQSKLFWNYLLLARDGPLRLRGFEVRGFASSQAYETYLKKMNGIAVEETGEAQPDPNLRWTPPDYNPFWLPPGSWMALAERADHLQKGDVVAHQGLQEVGEVVAVRRNGKKEVDWVKVRLNGRNGQNGPFKIDRPWEESPWIVRVGKGGVDWDVLLGRTKSESAAWDKAERRDGAWQKVPLDRVRNTLGKVLGEWATHVEPLSSNNIVLLRREGLAGYSHDDLQPLFEKMPKELAGRIYLLCRKGYRSDYEELTQWIGSQEGLNILGTDDPEEIAKTLLQLEPKPDLVTVGEKFKREDEKFALGPLGRSLALRLAGKDIKVKGMQLASDLQEFLAALAYHLGVDQAEIGPGMNEITNALLESQETGRSL